MWLHLRFHALWLCPINEMGTGSTLLDPPPTLPYSVRRGAKPV
jgi:hypothetical protein